MDMAMKEGEIEAPAFPNWERIESFGFRIAGLLTKDADEVQAAKKKPIPGRVTEVNRIVLLPSLGGHLKIAPNGLDPGQQYLYLDHHHRGNF